MCKTILLNYYAVYIETMAMMYVVEVQKKAEYVYSTLSIVICHISTILFATPSENFPEQPWVLEREAVPQAFAFGVTKCLDNNW